MTGKDLLDAIGSVDESLLERCQQTEQLTAKNHILWYWYRKKYISIATCACLLLLSTVGVTYWRSDFFSVSDTVVNGNTPGITALSDVYQPEEPERFPRQEKQDGTDSDVAKDTVNETRQDSSSSSINGTINDNYPADDLPDTDISSGTKSGVETTPKNSENTDTLQSPNEQITKVDETDSITPNYSQGIEIEPVKEVPKGAPSSEETVQPEGMHKPAKGGAVKSILKKNTIIIRGTVKNIQHFHATGGELDIYFSVVSLRVKEVDRADGKGTPQKGKICKVYLPAAKDSPRQERSILGKLTKGSEVIMLPYIAEAKTGIRNKKNFFAYKDVSDYYFDTKTAESQLFLKTKTGVLYNTKVYDIPHTGKRVTLNDVGNYLKKMLKD